MISVNVDDSMVRLSELVRAVEERNEIIVLFRGGREIAEIRRRSARRAVRNLTPEPRFHVEVAPGYDPTEPLPDDEWPDALR